MLVTAANLTRARYVNADSLSVTFSAAMDDATVLDAANYTISGAGAGDRTAPDDVTAGAAANEYLLTWTSGSFGAGETLTVEASEDVLDASSNPVEIPRTTDVYVPDGDWVFVGGSTGVDAPGSYPDPGDPDKVLQPGARDGAASWTDGYGDLWLFGGFYFTTNNRYYLNDLWKYEFPEPPAPQPGNTRIASAAFVDRNSISVTFSDEMPVTGGVMEPTNYRISGGGAGTRVAPEPTWEPIDPIIIIGGGGGGGGGAGGDGSTGGGGGGGGAGFLGGMAPRWADHTPTLANPATVQRLDENTYLLTWTAGQFAAGQPLIIHVDDEHIVDLAGDLLGAPNFMTLMIPFDAPGCICPTP